MKSMSNQADVLVDNWSGKAYHLFKEAVSFEEAMAKCEALGGVPVTYASSSEQVGRTQGGRARWRGLWCRLLLHSAVLSKVSAGLPLALPSPTLWHTLAHLCSHTSFVFLVAPASCMQSRVENYLQDNSGIIIKYWLGLTQAGGANWWVATLAVHGASAE